MGTLFETATDQILVCLQGGSVWPDGATLVLRGISPEDEAALEHFFFRLSPRTLYQRFFSPIPVMAHQAFRVTALARDEPLASSTVVAWDGHEIRGVASYVRQAQPHCAELSILIEDAWQGRGLGKPLLSQVILEAHRQAITRFTVSILEGNLPAFGLVRTLFAHPQFVWDGDVWQAHLPLEKFTTRDPD